MPLSTFTPDTDLRSTQVSPGASPSLQGVAGQTDASAGAASQFDLTGSAKQNASDFGSFLQPRSVGFRRVNTQVGAQPQIAAPGSFGSAQQQTDAASSYVSNYNPGQSTQNYASTFGNYLQPDTLGFQGAGGADLTAYRGQRNDAASAVATGPSRSAIASDRLKAFDTQAAPQLRDAEEQVAQRAAALGSVGAGRSSIEALRPYTDYLTNRSAMETNLAADTAEGEIADRRANLADAEGLVGQEQGFQQNERDAATQTGAFNIGNQQAAKQGALSAALSASGQDANYGLSRFGALGGLETARYGEAAGDRDYTTGVDTGNVARDMADRDAEQSANEFDVNNEQNAKGTALGAGTSVAGASGNYDLSRLASLGGLESQRYGQEANDRNELRTERGFQTGMEDQGYQRGMQKTTLEDALTNSSFLRALQQYQVGNQNNPSSTLLQLSQLSGNNANAAGQSLGSMLQSYGARAGMGGYGGMLTPNGNGGYLPPNGAATGPVSNPYGPLGIDGTDGAATDPSADPYGDPYGDAYGDPYSYGY